MEFKFHWSQKHPVKSNKHHKCQKCDFKCNNENDMKIHKASKHITSKNSEFDDKKSCDHCDFHSSNHFDLLLHNSMKHTGKIQSIAVIEIPLYSVRAHLHQIFYFRKFVLQHCFILFSVLDKYR